MPSMWKPADATKHINACARRDDFTISLTLHAREQMAERALIVGDVTHVLKNGFVYDDPEKATREGYFKYHIEGVTPNSGGRTIRLVVIPSGRHAIKIVTVMWRDDR